MVLSADKVTQIDDNVTFYVFSDNPDSAEDLRYKLKNVKIQVFKIQPYRWPEATLLRYHIFNSHVQELPSELLMHLDADMLFVTNPWDRIKKQLISSSVCLVEHPGFWRPTGTAKLFLYASHPFLGYRDLRLKFKRGGIGAWEENKKSSAYIDRKSREKYFCGGTWFGNKKAICDLIESLAFAVQSDLNQNLIATWHDESHINKWSTKNQHGMENPELCFDETYPQIRKLEPSIVAVRKIGKTR